VAVFLVLLRLHGLYSRQLGRLTEALGLVKVASLATMAMVTLTFFYRGYSYSRATVLIFYPLCIVALLGARALFRVYSRAVLSNRAAARRVLIVGFGQVGRHLGQVLLDDPSYYELVGFLDDDPQLQDSRLGEIRVVGRTADLAGIVRERRVEEVILAMPSAPQDELMELVGVCLRLKLRWKAVPGLFDLMLDRVQLDNVDGVPLIGLRGSNVIGFNWAMKRAFDLALSATVLLLLSPLLALIALAIKLTSKGPVLFRQTRVGLAGRTFTLLKFRSMRTGNDADIHRDFTKDWIYGKSGDVSARSVGAAAVGDAAVHKIRRDPRVTAVGRLLRKTSLDELPQFWNVLRGEMSVVGPRPALPYEVGRYTEWHKRRLDALPGITGLWQISGRNSLSFDEMVRLDIRYIESWSFEQDLKIVLKTIPSLLFNKAY